MRYRITGVWLSTRQDGVLFLEAGSPGAATEEACRRGLEVHDIHPVGGRVGEGDEPPALNTDEGGEDSPG